MKMFIISDNQDTHIGLRLVGVDGVVVKTSEEFKEQLNTILEDKTVGILLIMEKLCRNHPQLIDDIKLNRRLPLIVEIPDRYGTGRGSDFISAYIRDAIGIKI